MTADTGAFFYYALAGSIPGTELLTMQQIDQT